MKLKKEFIILFIIIAALAAYLLLHQKDRTHYQLPAVSEIAKNRITQIDIDTATDAVTLKRKDNSWYIGPEAYPADPDKVNAILDVIEKLTITALVSESKNYLRYDLNDGKKITVKAWDGTAVKRRFDIGKSATTYRHTFVTLDQDPHVYHARGDFRHKFDLNIDKLRDKNVLSFEPDHIKAVHISKDKKTIAIQRIKQPGTKDQGQEGAAQTSPAKAPAFVWQADNDQQLDESALKRLLSSLSRLNCENYINDRKKEDLANPIIKIKLTGEAEVDTLSIFPKTGEEETTHPAVSSESPYPFLLSATQVNDIKKTTDEVLKETSK